MRRDRFARMCPAHREPILAPVVVGPSGFVEILLCPRGHFLRSWLVVELGSGRAFVTATSQEELDDSAAELRRAA